MSERYRPWQVQRRLQERQEREQERQAREEYLELLRTLDADLDDYAWDYEEEPVDEQELERQAREAVWRDIRDKWETKYRSRVMDFARHLEAFPYLGLAHPQGKLIFESIRHLPKIRITGSWWRARKATGAGQMSPTDFLPPPPNAAGAEGRFNHFGQAHFYLASTPHGAMLECLDQTKREVVAWVQGFAVHELTGVLDLTFDPLYTRPRDLPRLVVGLIHVHLPALRPDRDSAWKPEYFVPRFIADCAKKLRFNGILYQGRHPNQRNLVIFKWNNDQVKPSSEPVLESLGRAPGS